MKCGYVLTGCSSPLYFGITYMGIEITKPPQPYRYTRKHIPLTRLSVGYRKPYAKLSPGVQMIKRLFDNAFLLEFFSKVFCAISINAEVKITGSGGRTNVDNIGRWR